MGKDIQRSRCLILIKLYDVITSLIMFDFVHCARFINGDVGGTCLVYSTLLGGRFRGH